ncbi:tyrosine-type recombinase/integrase [Mycobacterium sp. CVI_P3]|uniref:Tyrosine-type recombinase/integrase n=1 Tax=Mycobacterium pinniadriaticum TaxID=2994102 RepID=A0ABT3SJU1_9MYCO|nr:tyrosine-type recombinase/integrase [Mycobacterium pinniadriaticum]MCX2933377.1 tyrosine-type recombinase/integrase [Mycobacterium pinniadriaticum]MCX2939799.1 tyrosine-type recombinase/integrase [Mycobacterium pinniadriaticum]
MVERRQLPPQIKRVQLARRAGGRPVVRYQLTVDVGAVDGKRKQFRKRYATEAEARKELAEVQGSVAKGIFVHPSNRTVEQACEDWLAAKRAYGRELSTLHGYREKLTVVVTQLGGIELQKLTKRDIDDLVAALRAGGLKSPTGKTRKPWTPRSVNYLLGLLTAVIEGETKQGHVVRNVAALVDRIPSDPKKADTLTAAEVQQILDHIKDDRYEVAWQLALCGLRRGEIAGLRWDNIDLESKTLKVAPTRLRFGKQIVVKGDPKSQAGQRTLPLPDHLFAAFKSARAVQAADRLMLGEAYHTNGYVVVDNAGRELSPHALTSRWERMLKAAGVRHVRLHDARHTCGTLMHLSNVPIAVISAWLGHASKSFTMQTYVNPKPEALSVAAQSLSNVASSRDQPV